ncbi:MAG TPA: glycosyltransferase family 4 protein [Polyangia bacterium]|jgi:glycosyltransferase involved in cell wall biosynthesis|nr:glycosyltransferase family 4 protein [Polyangia bacterium]
MKRLLVLAPAPTSAASTRFRLEQFFPALRAAGIEPTLRPFLDEPGFAVLYRPGARGEKVQAALRALAGRMGDLARARDVDAVLIHREAALVGPPVLEWLLARPLGRPLVFDLDDAVWVPYSSPTYGALLSRLLKAPGKTYFTLRAAAAVMAGNEHIAEEARRYNRNVHVVPTVVDTEIFRPVPRSNPVPVLGWIGTPSSAQYLRILAPVLARLAERHRFVVRIVGAPPEFSLPGVPVELLPWQQARELSDFQGLDIGLYPLALDAWSLGKSGFKAVQYMACGVPVIASPVGVTAEMIRHDETGLLARDEAEWTDGLERLLGDARLRARLGDAGRAEAVAHWSLAVHAPRVVDILYRVVSA